MLILLKDGSNCCTLNMKMKLLFKAVMLNHDKCWKDKLKFLKLDLHGIGFDIYVKDLWFGTVLYINLDIRAIIRYLKFKFSF